MALHLSTSVGVLPGLGDKAVKDLKNLGVVSIRDLLLYFPFRYDDFSHTKPIGELRSGDTVTVTGVVNSIESRKSKNRRVTMTEAMVGDESGEIKVIWFNQPYLEKTLREGSKVSLAGTVDAKYGISLVSPVHEPAGKRVHTGRIVPVYGRSGTLSLRRLRQAISSALPIATEMIDWLPQSVVHAQSFPSLMDALKSVHFPESREELEAAIQRLKFDELFLHQMMYAEVRQTREVKKSFPMEIDEAFLKTFSSSLPFELTADQKRAAWEIIQDCAEDKPMNRLLEGDVGSGKTVVAAFAIANVMKHGGTAVYLAPTEILAGQQHASLSKFLDEPVALLTRSSAILGDEEIKKVELLEKIGGGEVNCIVGTHALLQDAVTIPDVQFVVIDEQHRFGVQQRHALLETGEKPAPHLLSMTATPIPRSLALTLYGDLELSIIKQMPAGRKPIKTLLSFEKDQKLMWEHVKREIAEGRKVYIVAPLIDPSDKLGARSVTEVAAGLKKNELKGEKIEVLHGKLKADEKEKILTDFRDGETSVVVSTTVVEVGVDVPNATIMIITGAERFGLAQLHQLRGRVGRSDLQSFCYLVPDAWSANAKERLMAMVQSTDGFALAEKDLELRGAGNIFGSAQSGFPDFQLATPADVSIMKTAREEAMRIQKEDSSLESYPLLKQFVQESLDAIHLE